MIVTLPVKVPVYFCTTFDASAAVKVTVPEVTALVSWVKANCVFLPKPTV